MDTLTPDNTNPVQHDYRVADDEFEHLISHYARDLTKKVRDGRTDPIIGREAEVDQVTTILLQRGRSNACLLGGAGVGKTALFTALARELVMNEDNLPNFFRGARVIELEWGTLGAGASTRGEYEGRLVPILNGAAERNDANRYGPIIFCLDEIHTIMQSSGTTSAAGVSELLKPYLTSGDLQVVGATTADEYAEYIVKDPAMDRRFQKVELREPTVEETIKILQGIRPGFQRHFELNISDEMIEKTVELATSFLRGRNNPDKSIITLDGACARALKRGLQGKDLDLQSIQMALGDECGLPWSAIGPVRD